ncbi:diguanylate cyclase [Marinobacterium lacunae]|uniref:Diguanylate cyclase n=1 Tax=Marinobacterium lacunae TaxID=1232683 RepID=A0A081FYN0_9GAMM|nr:PAS domain-containing protein [Marinobacterium lacunae]KEA63635.1 diguanylate cyclase [Marinobacterium lacunae]
MDDLIRVLRLSQGSGQGDGSRIGALSNDALMESFQWDMSQEELSRLLASITDMIAIIDNKARYKAVSSGYAAFFSSDRETLIGKRLQEVHRDSNFVRKVSPRVAEALGGQAVRLDLWEFNSSDQQHYLDISLTPFADADAKAGGAIIVARDMTDLALSQAGLNRERHMMQLVINAIPDFIFVKDVKGVYQYCNAAFVNFMNLSEERIIGACDADLMSQRSAAYIMEQDTAILEQGEARRVDEWVTYNDGRRQLLDMYKFPIRNDEGRIEGLVGIGRDVTAERQAAEKIKQAALVFDTTSDCCFILDAEGRVVSANSAAHQAFGYAAGTLLGVEMDSLIKGPEGCCSVNVILKEQNSWRGEVEGRDVGGNTRPYIGTLNSVTNAQGELSSLVLTLTDISEQKRVEQELMHQACKDPLTDLPNRLLMRARMEHAIQKAQRGSYNIAAVFVDLDGFKAVNDTYGHELGDTLLKQVGERLKSGIRKSDTLSRLGGDEFLLLVDELSDIAGVHGIAEKLLGSFGNPFDTDVGPIKLSASIGISFYPQDGMDVDDLVRKADLAMYQAKRTGRNRYCFYGDVGLDSML